MAYRDPFVLPATPEQKAKAQRIKQVQEIYFYTCVKYLYFMDIYTCKICMYTHIC